MERSGALTSAAVDAGPMSVRAGRLADLDAIVRIETTAFASDQLSRRSLRRFLGVPTTDTVVAADGTDIAGYAMIGFRRTSRVGRIFSLAVGAGSARRGLGRALLAACEAAAWRRDCTGVRLEVRADNVAAVALYERAGYTPAGRMDAYYEDGAAALVFVKPRSLTT